MECHVSNSNSSFQSSYVPKYTSITNNPFLLEFFQKHSFATLLTAPLRKHPSVEQHSEEPNPEDSFPDELPLISHIPFLVLQNKENDSWSLFGHLAYANLQWKCLQECEHDNREVLVLFQGPHAYISPSFYVHNEVPTWNYSSCRVYGVPKMIENTEQKWSILEQLIAKHEAHFDKQWKMSSLPKEHLESQIKKIKFFQIPLQKIVGKFKMSQNRVEEDQQGVISNLLKGSVEDIQCAELMSLLREQNVAVV